MALQPNTKNIVIPQAPVGQLLRAFNIANLRPPAIRENNFDGRVPQPVEPDPALYTSLLGTPVVIDLTLGSVTYTDFVSRRKITTTEIVLQTVLCTVSRPSILVKTQIAGRNGTVKEYISKDDHYVTINGIITGQNGVMPALDVLELKSALDAPVPLPVSSRFLNNLGVYNIVVEDVAMPQEAGGISKQAFTISAVSDEPIELQIQ